MSWNPFKLRRQLREALQIIANQNEIVGSFKELVELSCRNTQAVTAQLAAQNEMGDLKPINHWVN